MPTVDARNFFRDRKTAALGDAAARYRYRSNRPVYYITDVYCVDPPGLVDGTVHGLESRDPLTGMFPYGTLMSYACLNGRRFEDGHAAKRVRCVLNGVWNETEFTCERTRALLLLSLRRGVNIAMSVSVCLLVCPLAYFRNCTTKL